MMRLLRCLPCVAIACVLSIPFVSSRPAALAQFNQVNAEGDAEAELARAVENFWHYAKIARYDLAANEAQRVLGRPEEPVEVLAAFEQVTDERRDNLDEWLLRWQAVDELREPVTQLIGLLNEGRRARRGDPAFIEENVQLLSQGERAYAFGIERLRDSGELAVPIMLEYLRDQNRREHHTSIRRGLRDLGRVVLNPLVTSTEMQDQQTLIAVINALGDIGYEASAPYLVRVAQREGAAPEVRNAANRAMILMGAGDAANLDPAELFYQLGQRFYYHSAAITPPQGSPVAFVWYWDDDSGLVRQDVPPEIFNEIMAMRANELALRHDPDRADALALWLAANYKREVELPEDQTDPTRDADQPGAHYYGVSSGTRYLNAALERALNDGDAAVSLRVIESLHEIVGESNLFNPNASRPLIEAMAFPDRLVRFEAAFALAAALPQQEFTGQDRVVPILAEAVAQTGTPSVLVVTPDRDRLNELMEGLQGIGYAVAGATDAAGAVAESAALPAVDVILLSEELGHQEIQRLFGLTADSIRLERAAKVIMTRTRASDYARMALDDPLIHDTQATDAAGVQPVIEQARARSGALRIDEQLATQYALRSAELLRNLAISRGQVLDVSAAQSNLLAALDDQRAEVVMAAGSVLALMESGAAQEALAIQAQQQNLPANVRVSLYGSLATNAKFFGNQLDDAAIERLQETVEREESLEVRSAAAEAHGALNLPADRARNLILQQSRL